MSRFSRRNLDFLPRAEHLAFLVDTAAMSLIFLPLLRWLSSTHHPSTSVSLRTTSPQYFADSQYYTSAVLLCLSVPYHPVLRYLSVSTRLPPLLSERITNAPCSHSGTYNLRSVSCDPRPFPQWPVEPLEIYVESSEIVFPNPFFATSPNHQCFIGPRSADPPADSNCK